MTGENKSDFPTASNYIVSSDGQSANERVTTFMSKVTKETIESEFAQFGVSDWQEMMAMLINERGRLLQSPPLPQIERVKVIEQSQPVAKPIRFWKWAFIFGTILIIVVVVFLFKKGAFNMGKGEIRLG
jgi:hypothetical protein